MYVWGWSGYRRSLLCNGVRPEGETECRVIILCIRKRMFLAKRRHLRNYVCISMHIFMIQHLKFVCLNMITIGLFVLCGASSTKSFRNSPVSFAMTVSLSLYRCRSVRPSVRTSNQVSTNFNVSPCIFQFNNWQTPTRALHIQQYISLECWFQCYNT